MLFAHKIIHWFSENKRDLPWRNTENPYHIWLSEIILQQTRVNQGMSYYYAFLEKYPTIIDLANAHEQEILKTWQGLGYYSRARNLHATAKIIAEKYEGNFPQNYDEILQLKGVGKYTAAAIASFAFKQSHPVIDGNVYRFISRLYGIFTPINSPKAYSEFLILLEKLIDPSQPDLFNQALMEFGALHCKPQNPDCESCIFQTDCYAFAHQKQKELPIKEKKLKIKTRYFYYLFLQTEQFPNSFTCLQQRKGRDIWENLNQFPLIETAEALSSEALEEKTAELMKILGVENYTLNNKSKIYKHQLTHQTLFCTFLEIGSNQNLLTNFDDYFFIPISELGLHPVPRIIEMYLQEKF